MGHQLHEEESHTVRGSGWGGGGGAVMARVWGTSTRQKGLPRVKAKMGH